MSHLNLKNKKIHFVGVSGSGMIGICQFLVDLKFCTLSGSDMNQSKAISNLIDKGLVFYNTHHEDHVKDADIVVLCPVYTAGEKIRLGFNYTNFAKEIIKNSKVKLFLVNDNNQLAKFLKMNMYGKKIVIGMGAGSISNWMAKLPQLM